MLIGRHLEPHHARTINFDDHPLNGCDNFITWKRILPGLQRRMAKLGFHQVHLAYATLVLLESSNLLRVRRPEQNRAVAVDPASVVGSIAEIFYAVGSKLRFLAGSDVS